jgi:hypothetical protein
LKIFISHSSKDKLVVNSFVENILILGCGISEKSIFCSSIEGLGIKNGYDFREHILKELLSSDYSFLFISNNYKESDICLNEMGASWAIKNIKVKPFLFPNINFSSIGALFSVKQASKLNDSYALDELFEEVSFDNKVEKPVVRWNKYKSNFLDYIEQYKISKPILTIPSPEEYFGKFIKDNASLNNLFLKAHPTLLDCKAIFTKDYYKTAFQSYCIQFEEVTINNIEPLYPKYTSFRIRTNSSTEIMSGNNKFAGGMRLAAEKGIFKYDVIFYNVQFLKNESSINGNSFSVFCYLEGRWVFFPKPWRGFV